MAALAGTVDLIRRHNPDCKFLLTVSPVPLRYTLTDGDILTANTYSKSVLRAACETLVERYGGLDCFPSFEAALLSRRGVWERDRRHVSDRFFSKIVEAAISQYFGEREQDDLHAFAEPSWWQKAKSLFS